MIALILGVALAHPVAGTSARQDLLLELTPSSTTLTYEVEVPSGLAAQMAGTSELRDGLSLHVAEQQAQLEVVREFTEAHDDHTYYKLVLLGPAGTPVVVGNANLPDTTSWFRTQATASGLELVESSAHPQWTPTERRQLVVHTQPVSRLPLGIGLLAVAGGLLLTARRVWS